MILTSGIATKVLRNPSADGMEHPATDEVRVGTDRAGGPAQQDAALAGARAKAKRRGVPSSSLMKANRPSVRIFTAPGPGKSTRQFCNTSLVGRHCQR